MKVRICYKINDYNDFYILEAATVEEIKAKNEIEMKKRNLDRDKNEMYSVTEY